MARINRIEIDSSRSVSQLCSLGAESGTDKSPYSSLAGGHHRHAYTSVYDLIFASKRYEPITFCELGILDNRSMVMWREYFPQATLVGLDAFEEKLTVARSQNLHNTHYYLADVKSESSLVSAFNALGQMYDVMIDDSTHLFDDQIRFVKAATRFLKPGGILIVEDVFKHWKEKRYSDALEDISAYYSSSTFLVANHRDAFSEGTYEPYFDNDKMLFMARNTKSWSMPEQRAPQNLQRLSEIVADLEVENV